MDIDEVREIIEFAETIEGRKFPDGAVEAWCSVVADVPIEEARVAAAGHYRYSTEHLMPGHIESRRSGWEPSLIDDIYTDTSDSWMPTRRDPEKARKIRDEKFRAEAKSLGVDPGEILKSV